MNNQIAEDLNNIKIASERILQTVLDAKVGAKKIQVKRDVTELSRETETILNLENQRQSILSKIQIELNLNKYLKSISDEKKKKDEQEQEQEQKQEQQKQSDQPTIEVDDSESERDEIKDSGDEQENSDENENQQNDKNYVDYNNEVEFKKELKKLEDQNSILKSTLLELTEKKSEQQLAFIRTYQSQLIDFVSKDDQLKNDNEKLFSLIQSKDELTLKCLEMVSKIKENCKEKNKLKMEKMESIIKNRYLFENHLKNKILGEHTIEYKKTMLKIQNHVIECLIYGSKENWNNNEKMRNYFLNKYKEEEIKDQNIKSD
ncbi:hypothetical protein ACTFIU_005309 [Dictyostelium citrinum]